MTDQNTGTTDLTTQPATLASELFAPGGHRRGHAALTA